MVAFYPGRGGRKINYTCSGMARAGLGGWVGPGG